MTVVRAKKNLGQHFLTDYDIARKIVDSLTLETSKVLEVGPGMGVLTQFLFESEKYKTLAVDVDQESIDYLKKKYPTFSDQIIYGDFLRMNLEEFSGGEKFSIIGNFPYNISSQIFFKVLENKNLVPEVVGMLQKEVAERLASPPGHKAYGILSVFLQAYYTVEYLFTVHPDVFNPPPKVQSAVIRVKRNDVEKLDCDEVLLVKIVKAAFNQRRKMLRNSIKPFIFDAEVDHPFMTKRPEQLSVSEFVELTNFVSQVIKSRASKLD